MRVAGIMSGTSLDGIDVAVVGIGGKGFGAKFKVEAFATYPYPAPIRVNTRSTIGNKASSAGTNEPSCAKITISAACRK